MFLRKSFAVSSNLMIYFAAVEVIEVVVIYAVVLFPRHRTVVISRNLFRLLYINECVSCRSSVAPRLTVDFSQRSHPHQPISSPFAHPFNHGLNMWMGWRRSLHALSWRLLPISYSHTHSLFGGHTPVLPCYSRILRLHFFFWVRLRS
jgi:hypothetical protein